MNPRDISLECSPLMTGISLYSLNFFIYTDDARQRSWRKKLNFKTQKRLVSNWHVCMKDLLPEQLNTRQNEASRFNIVAKHDPNF